jgi:hypothetical protein
MSVAAQRCKILAHMFDRALQNLDRIQNSTTAHACAFDSSKIEMAKNAIRYVIAELEAQVEWDSAD